MQAIAKCLTHGVLIAASMLASCSTSPVESPDVLTAVRKSIGQAGLKDVTVSQDRVKGVVTLGGQVRSENEKEQAERLVKPLALGQVVAMEIAVVPLGVEKDAKAINSEVDQGIESNLTAALISNKLNDFVEFDVKNAVVTLHGHVQSMETRARAETVAAGVPYVKQVVNTLQIKAQKATSTE